MCGKADNKISSVTQLCPILWPHGLQASLSITSSWSLLKLMSIELLMPSCHLIFCCPCPCLQSFPASGSFQISYFFASGGPSIGSFSFSITPSSEYSALISFRMDWLDLLVVQGTLKSLLQHHGSKHQTFGTQLSLWSNSHIRMWLLEKW